MASALSNYLDPLGLRRTMFAVAADISWDDQNLVQPDLLVVHPEDLSATWKTVRRLRLAVEVMSPSSSRRDRLDKRTLYQEHGVETYWAVDLEARMVERWHPADARPELIGDALLWRAYRGAPEMSIDLAWLFADLPK